MYDFSTHLISLLQEPLSLEASREILCEPVSYMSTGFVPPAKLSLDVSIEIASGVRNPRPNKTRLPAPTGRSLEEADQRNIF